MNFTTMNVQTLPVGIPNLSDKDLNALYYHLRDLVDGIDKKSNFESYQFYYLKLRAVSIEMDYRNL